MRSLFAFIVVLILISPTIVLAIDKSEIEGLESIYDLTARIDNEGVMHIKWYTLDYNKDFTVVLWDLTAQQEQVFNVSNVNSINVEGLDISSEYQVVVYNVEGRTPFEDVKYRPVETFKRNLKSPNLTLSMNIQSLDLTLFPQITLSSEVIDLDNNSYISGLHDVSYWNVYENGSLVTDCFDVKEEGFSLVDVVFIIDYSGSMGGEIEAVKNNVRNFVDELNARGWDFRLGLVRFGSYSDYHQDPHIFNGGNLTDDVATFKSWLDEARANGNTERGLLAVQMACEQFNFRPGSQRHFILITDEDSDGGSLTSACSCCNSNNIRVHVAVNYGFGSTNEDYVDGIANCTNGLDFNVLSDYSSVLSIIGNSITSVYFITYCTPNPDCDGAEREVRLEVNYGGQTASDIRRYIPCACPVINRTEETIRLSDASLIEGVDSPIIGVVVEDSYAPYVQSVRLFYRTTGSSDYKAVDMSLVSGNNEDGLWQFTIPSQDVKYPGIDYYILATDGECKSTSPTTDPAIKPFQIAVLPNEPPRIVHNVVTNASLGNPVTIEWEAYDNTHSLVRTCLHYRPAGTLQWNDICEENPSTNNFSYVIPASEITESGIEYYIDATDDLGITSYHGFPDNPHKIIVSMPCDQPMLYLTGYKSISWNDPNWTVQVEIENLGPGKARNIVAKMNEDIEWLSIPDPKCNYGDLDVGQSSYGLDTYTFDLSNHPGGSFNVWFDVSYEDECGNTYNLRLDPEFDPDNVNDSGEEETPVAGYYLAQNYPNPFNPSTIIRYRIAEDANVKLAVYDVNGRMIRLLVNSPQVKGEHSVEWDGKGDYGRSVSSGVYFYKLEAGAFVCTRRMVLLR